MLFYAPIDLLKNELRQAVAQVLGAAPGSPAQAQFYFDSTVGTLYVYSGSAWVACDPAKVADGHIPLAKLATNPLARANHTGTQTASTISDFDTQVRTSRLDQMANPTASVSLNSQKITNLANGTSSSDAVNKGQLDDAVAGLSWKDEVACASTANLGLSGLAAIDGYTPSAGDRILAKNQTTGSQNGLYVAAAGAWSRATDADTEAEIKGAAVFVANGTTNGGSRWVLNNTGTITIGTTSLTFAQFGGGSSYSAGNGLDLTGSTFSVKTPASSGLTVDTTGVYVDRSLVPMKYAATIGDGSTTVFAITHSLNTTDVTVSVRKAGGSMDGVLVDWEVDDANNITLRFSPAPASNEMRVTVIG